MQSLSRTVLSKPTGKILGGGKILPENERLMLFSSEVLRRSTKSSEAKGKGGERAKKQKADFGLKQIILVVKYIALIFSI